MNPLVSICIPAYNAARFIGETLESALAQTYPHVEIIVSDDASQDRTVAIVEQYHSRSVKLIRQETNLGRYGNCNSVIRASSGKFVLKLDADDLIDPSYVEEQLAVMESNPEITFSHCACRLIDADGKFLGYERSIHVSFIRDGIQEWPRYAFGPRAVNIVMLRRSSFDQVGGYDERYRYSGDWAMHRALLRIGSVYYNDHVIASYRLHLTGKQGIRAIQAREHLLHLQDMEREWPAEVGGKEKTLRMARLTLGLAAAQSAAFCGQEERREILELLPEYGDNLRIKLLGRLVGYGGSAWVRAYLRSKLLARQAVKGWLYP